MEPIKLEGFSVVFLNFVAFALVVGALFVIVHALGRPLDRWRLRWSRWVWVALGAEYILALAVLLIRNTALTMTILVVSMTAALVVQTWYFVRVAFGPKRLAKPEAAAEASVPTEPASMLEEPLDADA
jgi:uncharacterized membrane protein